MKFWITLTLVLLTSYLSVYGQQYDLRGNIKLNDGKPISHATVRIINSERSTMSDENGHFVIKNIPYGVYEIEISSMEIIRRSFKINFKNDKVSPTFNVEQNDKVLEEVLVHKKTAKAEIETKGFAVDVIEPKLASLQSVQTNELLDRSAGVRIRQDGGLGSHIHYNINGMTGNAIKIFINGVPSTNYGSSFSLNSIPPSLIERIEVYKGVVPGYLSEDALGGAINVILKQNKKNTLTTSYSIGSFNTHQFNANGAYRKKSGFIVDASAFYNYSDNNYKVWGYDIAFNDHEGGVFRNQTAKRFHDAYRSYGTKVDLGFTDVKWADRFTVGGIFSDEYNEIQHGITMYRPFGDRHSTRNSKVATLNYTKTDFLLNGLDIKVDASYSHLKTQIIDSVGLRYDWSGKPIWNPETQEYMRYRGNAELGNRQTAEINTDRTLLMRTNLTYTINEKNIFYVNYLFNNFDRGVSDEFLALGMQLLQNTRDLRKNVVTATYENISFSEKLRTNIFYKYYTQKVISNAPYQITANPPEYGVSSTSKSHNYSGYGITLSYAVSPRFYILGSAEKAIRFPNATEIFGNAAENLLPANLEPEKSFNANLGFNVAALNFDEHSFRLNASLFFRDTKDMIRMGFAENSTGNSYYENLEGVLSKGVDGGIIYSYGNKFNFTFNVSKFAVLFNTRYDQKGAEYLYYRSQIRNEPSFKYNISGSYHLNNLFQQNSRALISYNAGYVKGFLRNWANAGLNNLDYIPTQFTNDLGVLYTFPSGKISLSVDAKNIFNEQVFDNFGLQKPGRAFYTKITYSIL